MQKIIVTYHDIQHGKETVMSFPSSPSPSKCFFLHPRISPWICFWNLLTIFPLFICVCASQTLHLGSPSEARACRSKRRNRATWTCFSCGRPGGLPTKKTCDSEKAGNFEEKNVTTSKCYLSPIKGTRKLHWQPALTGFERRVMDYPWKPETCCNVVWFGYGPLPIFQGLPHGWRLTFLGDRGMLGIKLQTDHDCILGGGPRPTYDAVEWSPLITPLKNNGWNWNLKITHGTLKKSPNWRGKSSEPSKPWLWGQTPWIFGAKFNSTQTISPLKVNKQCDNLPLFAWLKTKKSSYFPTKCPSSPPLTYQNLEKKKDHGNLRGKKPPE